MRRLHGCLDDGPIAALEALAPACARAAGAFAVHALQARLALGEAVVDGVRLGAFDTAGRLRAAGLAAARR